jgi:hypothetical protein
MSEFLLLGTRSPDDREVSPTRLAADVAAAASWHRWMRRWGLLRSFALPPEPRTGLRACLIVQASGPAAASRLASSWGMVSGYRVMVTPLCTGAAAEGGSG